MARGTKVAHYPEKRATMMDRVMERMGLARAKSVDIITLSQEIRQTLKAALPFTMADHAAPQARLPFAILETR